MKHPRHHRAGPDWVSVALVSSAASPVAVSDLLPIRPGYRIPFAVVSDAVQTGDLPGGRVGSEVTMGWISIVGERQVHLQQGPAFRGLINTCCGMTFLVEEVITDTGRPDRPAYRVCRTCRGLAEE